MWPYPGVPQRATMFSRPLISMSNRKISTVPVRFRRATGLFAFLHIRGRQLERFSNDEINTFEYNFGVSCFYGSFSLNGRMIVTERSQNRDLVQDSPPYEDAQSV